VEKSKHSKMGQPTTLHRIPNSPAYAQLITRFSYNGEQEIEVVNILKLPKSEKATIGYALPF
jgi:hypothetical protein